MKLLFEIFKNEDRAGRFIRSNEACINEILEEAEFDKCAEVITQLRLQFLGKPDVVRRLQSKGIAVLEIALTLTPEHVNKDFIYLLDPALEEQPLEGLIWVCDEYHPVCPKMIDYYGKRLDVIGKKTLALLTVKRFDRGDNKFRFQREKLWRRESRVPMISTNLWDQLRNAAVDEVLDTPKIADVLGVSHNWILRSKLTRLTSKDGSTCKVTMGDISTPLTRCGGFSASL
jgi:hypothetical protein